MAKSLTCPSCGAKGLASDERIFEVRGIFQSKPVRRCTRCGTGMFVKMLGKPREIDPELWRRMQASWSKQFGGPSSSSSSPTSPEPQSGAEADDISIDHPLGDHVIARLESSGSHVIRDDLITLFEPEANLRSSDFDRGTAGAIDLQSAKCHE